MADVIDLAERRKKLPEKPTFQDIATFCLEEITSNWERFARNNRLNDYFVNSTPSWASPGVNYLTDLNSIALIENKINLPLELLSPGSTGAEQLGWIAAFRINENRVMTPFMMSEQYARCFNILLFLKLGRELVQNGISIE